MSGWLGAERSNVQPKVARATPDTANQFDPDGAGSIFGRSLGIVCFSWVQELSKLSPKFPKFPVPGIPSPSRSIS